MGCVHLPGLICSGSGSGSQVLSKVAGRLGLCFVSFPGLSSSGDQVFSEHSHPKVVHLITSPIPAARFSGCTRARLLRCAVCLFWGTDLWLQPSQWMSTIQNPKNSWLAVEPVWSLVEDDASLGPRLPLSGSDFPPPDYLRQGIGQSTAC